jgi:hypothetical protein
MVFQVSLDMLCFFGYHSKIYNRCYSKHTRYYIAIITTNMQFFIFFIFNVLDDGISILGSKYYTLGTIIALILVSPSSNTSSNTDPLYKTLLTGLYSCCIQITRTSLEIEAILHDDIHFLNSFLV